MSFLLRFALALLVSLALSRTSVAHHSFSMYDSEKLLKLEGTIKEFQWTNPHAIVWVTGTTTPGQPAELWTVELPTSPGNLSRMGWKRTSLSPGDPVVLEINPLRDGSRGGSFKKATVTSTGVVLVATMRDEPPAQSAGTPGHAGEDHDHDHEHEQKPGGCSLAGESARGAAGGGALVALGCVAFAARARRRRARSDSQRGAGAYHPFNERGSR